MTTTNDTTNDYEILYAVNPCGEFYGRAMGDWEVVPADVPFASLVDAEAAIPALRRLEGWEQSVFAIRRVGARWPELGTIDWPEVNAPE